MSMTLLRASALLCLVLSVAAEEAGSDGAPVTLEKLGCWKDTSSRAIPLLEGQDPLLAGNYLTRTDAIIKCKTVAMKKGWSVFALQNSGACLSGEVAETYYKKFGASTACGADGDGGLWANEVYKIPGVPVTLEKLGCWKDTSSRAIPLLEGQDPLLTGNYQHRTDAIIKCKTVAMNRGWSVFAVQYSGACLSGEDAEFTYKKFGASTACATDGEGGLWSNEVYKIPGSTEDKKEDRDGKEAPRWCPHVNKFLGGYSSGEFVYSSLGEAQSQCQTRTDCGGVTKEQDARYTLRKSTELEHSSTGETSWKICEQAPRWCPHFNKFLGGYSSGEFVYSSLGEAQSQCQTRTDCGGVTKEQDARYTLRKSTELEHSSTGETSWKICEQGSCTWELLPSAQITGKKIEGCKPGSGLDEAAAKAACAEQQGACTGIVCNKTKENDCWCASSKKEKPANKFYSWRYTCPK